MAKRDTSIDLMRFVGFSLIVLAHIGLSRASGASTIFQLRSFDVPLMVFTSGLAFSGKNIGSYWSFIWKRALRLVVPVYIFVAAYILLNPLLSGWGLVEDYSQRRILGTFALRLNPSIGYVWIIRVFLIVMLVTPLLMKLEKNIRSSGMFYLTAASMLAVQAVLVLWLKPMSKSLEDIPALGVFVNDWLMYVFGYSAVFMTGLRFRKEKLLQKIVIFVILLAALAAMAFFMQEDHGTWLRFQQYKYPPQMYFLLWGMLISSLLWLTSRLWTPLLDNTLFCFIGRNTIWIYLWHIPFVNLVFSEHGYIAPFDAWPAVWKYVFVYASALCVYGLQYRLVCLVERRWPDNFVTKYFKG